jgi:hypothetical protein
MGTGKPATTAEDAEYFTADPREFLAVTSATRNIPASETSIRYRHDVAPLMA